jgi:8-oxo-dGTP pyrophosphatase MutT (NUDIX family)
MSPYFKQLRAKIGHDLLLMPGVAAAIRDASGRLLLQERASGEGWSLPAGAIEPGESPEQAIQREVLEETGLVVAPTEVLGVFGGRHPETKSLRYFAQSEMPRLAFPYPMQTLFSGS